MLRYQKACWHIFLLLWLYLLSNWPGSNRSSSRRIGKIKAVGSLWQQRLKHLVEVEQLGLRETARRLQVTSKTINRYVQLLGLEAKWRSPHTIQDSGSEAVSWTQSTNSNDLRSHHRNIWSALQNQYAQASKTALRRLAPATYSWLYRHDREWLNQNSPPIQRPVYVNNRVNWDARDEQILAQVREAVPKLLAAEKPIRITISRVGKAIGQLTLLEQHLDKMPLTQAYLNSAVETVEDFQIRRIRWAVAQLNYQGETVELWKVIRLAGLKPNYSETVARGIEFEIYGKTTVTMF